VAVSPKRKAALQVRVSAQAVGQFEPLDIKVVDPAPSQGSSPGLLTVALTDGAGARQRVVLNPLAQEGEWGGRFTPLTTGRYGGTASVKEKDGEHTGRVPVVRVNDSPLPGPVRLDPGSKRALRYSRGDVLFPVGARLAAGALHSPVEWGPELAKLRAHGATYLEVPVEWPASGKDQGRDLIHAVDALLREAEKRGSPIIQMRLQPPADLSGNAAAAYEAQLQEWVRRWSYSPVVGVWYVEGARESLPLETRRRFVRAVRNAEAYPHLVAAPGLASAKECGADLPVTPAPPRPRNQFGLIEAAEKAGDAKPEQADWKMLVLGGVGLPLRTYTPGAPDADAFLAHLEQLAAVASDVPFHAAPLPCKGAPSSGLFCRYGPAVVGWAAPDARRSVQLPSLAPGRYRVRIWNPAADRPAGEQEVQGSEKGARLALSGDLKRVFLTIRPARSRKS
jgi:hypothetical protein